MTLGDLYIRHKGKSKGATFTQVTFGPLTVWFSYETLVAFQMRGEPVVVRENTWGATTGKHLAQIDGGGIDSKKNRLPYDLFAEEFAYQTKGVMGNDSQD